MVSAWKPILAALVIFAAGVVTGGLTVHLRRPPTSVAPGGSRPERTTPPRSWLTLRPEMQIRELSQRMTKQLDLTSAQRERVERLLQESQGRMRNLADEMAPRTREELRRLREQLREELTPSQRRKLDELLKNRDWNPRRAAPTSPAASQP
jgi:hypothetical protein